MSEHQWVRVQLYADDWTEECLRCGGSRLHVEDFPCPGNQGGFTWEDVDLLRGRISEMRKVAQNVGPMHSSWEEIFALESLADRIASLLPPREETDAE